MREIPLTQGRITIVDDEYYPELSKYKWHADQDPSGCFYAKRVSPKSNEKRIRVHMARVVLELAGFDGTGLVVHHKSHDTLDNRLENLEFITNEDNRRDRKDNKAGFAGVSWKQSKKRFCAQISTKGKKHHIGLYDDPYRAALARIAWMEKHGIDTAFSVQQIQQALEDPDLIGEVNDLYQGGLVTGDEATDMTQGKTI